MLSIRTLFYSDLDEENEKYKKLFIELTILENGNSNQKQRSLSKYIKYWVKINIFKMWLLFDNFNLIIIGFNFDVNEIYNLICELEIDFIFQKIWRDSIHF